MCTYICEEYQTLGFGTLSNEYANLDMIIFIKALTVVISFVLKMLITIKVVHLFV